MAADFLARNMVYDNYEEICQKSSCAVKQLQP